MESVTTQDQLRQKYGAAAMRAGDLQYKILCYQAELAAANEEMKLINQESIELANKEKESQQEVADGQV